MARTATLPMPQNTTHPEPMAPAIQPGPTEQIPDWLAQQQHILRTAPDGDTAIRLLYAELLSENTLLRTENTRLTLALQAATAPPAPVARTVRPSLRPALLALLRARVGPPALSPLRREELEAALEAQGRLREPLREMVKAGQLVLNIHGYALAPDPSAAPAPATGPPAGKRGRIVRPA